MSFLKRLFGAPALPLGASAIGNFNLTAQLGDSTGRTMQMAGYIYADESKEQLEYRIDVMQEIMERQKTRAEIPLLEARREQIITGMKQARDVMAELEEKNRTGTLSSQERLNLRNLATNIEGANKELEKGTAAIIEAKRKAGVK